jgi:hypothetical protein
VARVPTRDKDELVEELCDSLRRVLKWAEAYEPSRQHRREYDADLDKAEALLAKTHVGRITSAR